MNETETKALNQKILNWLGFKYVKPYVWIYPDQSERTQAPYFTSSLDAQAKWIYPKLRQNNFWFHIYSADFGYGTRLIHKLSKLEYFGEHSDSPAFAFALAVEKYIDAQEVKL